MIFSLNLALLSTCVIVKSQIMYMLAKGIHYSCYNSSHAHISHIAQYKKIKCNQSKPDTVIKRLN